MTGYYLVKSSALWPISERWEFQQELKMQILSLELLNQDTQDKQSLCCRDKKDEIDALLEEVEKNCKRVESLGIRISLLRVQLDDREKAELNLKEKEKELVQNIVQVQSPLSAVECSLAEAKKLYEMMLEAKQLKSQ
ncbi:Synaptonemal complex protein [Nymphaea thermarum]|nr:Synaptonemal complex protein [Nymphaea thermarum]